MRTSSIFLGKEGRRFCEDLPFHLEFPHFFAEASQLCTFVFIDRVACFFSLANSLTNRLRANAQLHCYAGHRTIALLHQFHGLSFELFREPPSRLLLFWSFWTPRERPALSDESTFRCGVILLKDSAAELTGKFRDEQVWVGGDGYSPHGATQVAPHHERVPAAVDDLVQFINRQDLGRLAHIAVSHAQFETIHPFSEVNGRTGRVIIQRMLRSAGLTRRVILPLSAGLLTDTARYFESLNAYRTGDIQPIVSTFIDATFKSLDNASRLAEDLASVRESWNDAVSARADSTVWPLLDDCIGRPAVTGSAVAVALRVSDVAAQNAIDRLTAVGILRQNSPAKRNRIWLAPDVLDAIDQFMERARRK